MRVTKKQRLIDFIASKPEGVTYGEAQRFVVELAGRNYDTMEVYDRYDWRTGKTVKTRMRVWRGWWADHLTGPKGILTNYCTKVAGRYFIKKPSQPDPVFGPAFGPLNTRDWRD